MTISIDAALSGLKAAQRSLDVVSNNIANASTEGFTRKYLPQDSLVVGGEGIGVQLQAVMRAVDKDLLRDLIGQVSISENSATQQRFLDRIQSFHGPSEAERAISARVSNLASAFAELSNSPDNGVLIDKVLTMADRTVDSINDFSGLLNEMRNQTESEMVVALDNVNQALERIARLNVTISTESVGGQSIATLEDQRDQALKTVAKYMTISTYVSDNNKLVVMTASGQTLADETARTLSFQKSTLLPGSYYPGGGANGIFIQETGYEISAASSEVGGSIGALLTLRDETLPTYQAQIDELAQKMAYRFDQMGLRLFTDENGNVPANVADPGIVGYVGFAEKIKLNEDVVADPTLIRSGTYGAAIAPGSNEIIHRISEYAFGPYEYQEARGTVDISAGTVFAATGMTQYNKVVGTLGLNNFTSGVAVPSQFDLTIGVSTYNVIINPGDTAMDVVNDINLAAGSPVAALNNLGQLTITGTADITLTDVSLGAVEMAAMGLSFGFTPAQDPSFTVQVDNQNSFTVSISPLDTAVDLLATLNAIPGITASLGGGGELVVEPTWGGGFKMVNLVGTPLRDLGVSVTNIAHTAFRENNLGAAGNLSTGIIGNSRLEDFARNIVTSESQDHALVKEAAEKEDLFLKTLSRRQADQSGVDIDEEVSELVRIQTAYTAAARMIAATERLFDDLLTAFRR